MKNGRVQIKFEIDELIYLYVNQRKYKIQYYKYLFHSH